MCCRFVVARTVGEIQTIFEADELIGELPGVSYNVAPTQPIAIIVDRAFEKAPDGSPLGELSREIHSARWGLVPRWSKGPAEGAPLINGRIESLLEKPSFNDSVIRRRCVIPASGYYEWHVNADGTKQPFYINAGTDGMFALAGLFVSFPSVNESNGTIHAGVFFIHERVGHYPFAEHILVSQMFEVEEYFFLRFVDDDGALDRVTFFGE